MLSRPWHGMLAAGPSRNREATMPRACGWWGSALLLTWMCGPAWARVGGELETFESGDWARDRGFGRVETRPLDQPGRFAMRFRGKSPGEVWLVTDSGRIESEVLAVPLEGDASDSTEVLRHIEAFLEEAGLRTPPVRPVWKTILAAVEGQPTVLVTGGLALSACRLDGM